MTVVCLTFDFDATAIWLSSFRQTTPLALSRGEFGSRMGIPRIEAMLARRGVPATFFTPAHTASSFPGQVKALAAAGHEIAAHGFVHESPVGAAIDEERSLLWRSLDVLERTTGRRPVGYRSPAWDLSDNSIGLLEEAGLIYDSSLMATDFHPYLARRGDRATDERFLPGSPSVIVEIPVAWELDDFPYFHFGWKPLTPGLRSTDDVFKLWLAEFEAAHEEQGVFTLTCHPEVIGRAPRVKMLEQLITHMQAQEGVAFLTMAETARRFQPLLQSSARQTRQPAALQL